ncbi:platelet glycoprotein IX [Callorhinchus milii]|uniref:platelet glycoprotein IX n=1 Tax=Callorhinchus milii TaxID=7868 RepID=UPI0004575E40|nr:platelet glycoprotein IX [Callorhinchus milii]|eukprot:gi/632970227/ref/XP_007901532.1/ PREDICTED: platelet glycoprotein IX [Callorhinchus milii]
MAWVSIASTHAMLACIGAPLILLLTLPVGGVPCPDPCHCTPLSPGGLKVDCSRLGLREVPALPENTSELYLQSNRLTAVAPGTFDKPRDLRRVELSNNPWVCDCQIAYLRQWLRGQELRMERKIRCSSPASAKGKRVSRVTEEQSSCRGWWSVQCQHFIRVDVLLSVAALLTLCLSACAIYIAKHLSFRVRLTNPNTLQPPPDHPRARHWKSL